MFMFPAMGPITSRYGPRGSDFHSGMDIGWLLAKPVESKRVYAPWTGIARVSWNALVGNYITIDTPVGMLRLAHFANGQVAIKDGQKITMGQTYLGFMGDTGSQSSGVHLHIDLFMKDGRVDPESYFTIPFRITTPTFSTEDGDTMKLVKRSEAPAEWSLFHPSLSGPTDPERGYYVVTDVNEARDLARIWDSGQGTESVVTRDVYVGMQNSSRKSHENYLRSLPSGGVAPVDPQAIALAVKAALAGEFEAIPTAPENGRAARDAIVLPSPVSPA